MVSVDLKKWLVACAVTAITAGAAVAQPGISDPGQGRELANNLCSICHEVEPASQDTRKTDIPSFYAIANRAGQSPQQLAGAIILSPHPEMPKIALTTIELREIIFFVMSLRVKDGAP